MKLIDADALYEFMREKTEDGSPAEQMIANLKNEHLRRMLDRFATVDAVEVVRCRYCKHFIGGKAIGKCYRNPDEPIIPVFYNHFCSYGERRDDSGSGA